MLYLGVYAIKNNVNNKMYIGSSKNIKRRYYTHVLRLQKNKHVSNSFNNDWNTLGEDNFELLILEIVNDLSQLKEREQYYLDKFKTYDNNIGYNHCHNSNGGNGKGEKHPFYNKQLSTDVKVKISNTLLNRNLTSEHKKNISKSQIGHKRITPEVAEKIASKHRKLNEYQVVDILTRIENGESLKSINRIYDFISYSTIKGIKRGASYSTIYNKFKGEKINE